MLAARQGAGLGLMPWALFAAMLAAAGLPLYLNAPKLYAETYGLSLATLGGVLGALRLVDLVQDPVLGWVAERFRRQRPWLVACGVALIALAMPGLLSIAPPIAPLAWFALTMSAVTLAYSFLTIVFYAQGVTWAEGAGGRHLHLAGWREAGTLFGVAAAAALPSLLPGGAADFGWIFAGLAVIAGLAMRGLWTAEGRAPAPALPLREMFRPALADPQARWLLVVALVNSAPVAVTSTLFLFYVEDRLQLAALAGPFLLGFFLAAALSAPVWSRLADRLGARATLALGMGLSVAAFLWALTLGPGAAWAFAAICLTSGAALGADLVLLPALFSQRLARLGAPAAGFGLWAFVQKLALALAAATVLPLLQLQGYAPGLDPAAQSPAALTALSLAYAGLPCLLKMLALGALLASPIGKE